MKNIYLQIATHNPSDSPLILATVVKTNGSTPQKPGSSALFGKDGLIAGTVGGGIVEGKIQKMAADAILSGISGLYHFNLANDISKMEEAICGGQISVMVDADPARSASVFEQLKISLEKKIAGVLITRLTVNSERSTEISRYWISESERPGLEESFSERIVHEALRLITEKNPAGFSDLQVGSSTENDSSSYFLQPFFPPDQLIIAGAGHIGRSLAHLGNLLDFEVTVIDDRQEFANSVNIPDADHIIVKDIGEAMHEVKKGENTYVVIVTRGHKDDALALKPCIDKNLAYTGMIGSKNKISAMRVSFIDNGWATPEQWERIHAPIGLAIKSQTVGEIAISIAAELILVRNSRR
jgi:xanthine dehydrogenase accessory factor